MSRARELLRSVKNLSILRELAKTQGGLDSVGDLVDNFIDSEAMAVCLQRFKSLPGGKEMVEQRYPLSARHPCPGTTAGRHTGQGLRGNDPPPELRP